MFIKNKYHRYYYSLCSSRKLLGRIKSKNEYFERHHIIPKSLGGSDDEENLVLLTAREHFIAHLLLTKITKGSDNRKMQFAFYFMANTNGLKINSKIYESTKKKVSEIRSKYFNGENSGMYGKTHSEKTKKLFSEQRRGKNNPNYNKPMSDKQKEKISKANKGKIRSDKTRTKISESLKGNKNPNFGKDFSKEKNPFHGKSHSSESRQKISESHNIILTCPHCGKSGGRVMKRWHFDNCKLSK